MQEIGCNPLTKQFVFTPPKDGGVTRVTSNQEVVEALVPALRVARNDELVKKQLERIQIKANDNDE